MKNTPTIAREDEYLKILKMDNTKLLWNTMKKIR